MMPRTLLAAFFLASAGLASAASLPPTLTWTESAAFPEPRAGYGAGAIDGQLIIVGGAYWKGTPGKWTEKVFSAATHAFDPVTQTWTKLPDAPVTVGYPGYTQVNDELYIISGMQNGKPSPTVYVLRKAGSHYEWRRQGELPETRLFAPAITVGRTIYLVGGTHEFEPTDAKGTCCTSRTATTSLWALDTAHPASGWRRLADFPGEGRWDQKAVTDGTAIYMLGGSHQVRNEDPVKILNDVLRYDLAAGTWSRFSGMPEAMQRAAPVFAQGRILLIGAAQKAMVFDPKRVAFTPVAPLPREVRVDHFEWIPPFLVGTGGETKIERPRRRSEWTFLGRISP